jgi:hypothetical protein
VRQVATPTDGAHRTTSALGAQCFLPALENLKVLRLVDLCDAGSKYVVADLCEVFATNSKNIHGLDPAIGFDYDNAVLTASDVISSLVSTKN